MGGAVSEQNVGPKRRSTRFLIVGLVGRRSVNISVRQQEIVTQFKLLTVEDVFDIPGRGLIVVPGPLLDSFASPAEIEVLLKRPDGQELEATASITFQFQTPPPKEHRFAVILKGITKSDIPIGTEIWFTRDDED
jgi:hypothetical protein